ncbi:MAG: 4Fe-4S binding protein [Gorillibacterium sp.]|nr:4Fe-4S binding protein [Gorillibacterium sp.]
MGLSYIGRRFLGKLYIADNSCSGCGACARTCPVSTIRMSSGKPVWNWQCEGCMNGCPSESIQTSNARLIIFGCSNLLPVLPTVLLARSLSLSPLLAVFSGLAGYALLTFLLSITVDYAIRRLERNPATSKIFTISFTKHYRRYRNPNI